MNLLDPGGDNARHIAHIWWLMFALAIAVYVVVAGLIVFGMLRGRRTERGKASRVTDGSFIWVGGIAVPVAILTVLAVVTVTTTQTLRGPDRTDLQIAVVGHDWWWEVHYPARGITTAN